MAAGRDMIARLVLTLADRATAGLRALQARLSGLASAARRMSGIGAVIGAISFAAAIRSAASLEGKLRDIAITAGVSGNAIEAMQRQMRDANRALARQRALSSTDLNTAEGTLIGRGMERAQASVFMPTLARFASATGAAAEDLAHFTFTLERVANIEGVEGMQRAYAIAMRSGQLGGFEVRDMVEHLGVQLGRASGHGLRGHQAVATISAWNQVARDQYGRGGTRAAEAVDQALVQFSGEDFQKRMIEKLGMDPRRVVAHARSVGRDPVFALLKQIERLTRHDRGLIGEIIPDANAASAVRSAVEGWARMGSIRTDSGRAQWSSVEQAATDREQGLDANLRRFNEELRQLGENFGDIAGRVLPLATDVLKWFNTQLVALNDILDGKLSSATGFVAASIRSLADGLDALGRAFDQISEGVTGLLNRFRQGAEASPGEPVPPGQAQRRFNQRGRAGGFYGNDPAVQPQSAPGEQRSDWRGRIEIALAPGLVLRRGDTDTPGVSLTPDRGLMLRPV